jgi:hypothetical protein
MSGVARDDRPTLIASVGSRLGAPACFAQLARFAPHSRIRQTEHFCVNVDAASLMLTSVSSHAF